MMKKHRTGKIIGILGAITLVVCAASVVANEPVNEEKKITMHFAAEANVFRLEASADFNQALKKWTKPEFRESWEHGVNPLFPDDNNVEWRDFFSSAVVLMGCVEAEQAIVGYYNPWVDGLLLTHIARGEPHAKFKEFVIVSGETWRGERLSREVKEVLGIYHELEIPLLKGLAQRYAHTVERFTELFPPDGRTTLNPKGFENIKEQLTRELVPVKARMQARMYMFRAYLQPDNRERIRSMANLRKALAERDQKALKDQLSVEQPQTMLEAILEMPKEVLEGMAPNFIGKTKAGVVVGFVNPATPRWVMVAQQTASPEASQNVMLELLDLELSSQMLALEEANQ